LKIGVHIGVIVENIDELLGSGTLRDPKRNEEFIQGVKVSDDAKKALAELTQFKEQRAILLEKIADKQKRLDEIKKELETMNPDDVVDDEATASITSKISNIEMMIAEYEWELMQENEFNIIFHEENHETGELMRTALHGILEMNDINFNSINYTAENDIELYTYNQVNIVSGETLAHLEDTSRLCNMISINDGTVSKDLDRLIRVGSLNELYAAVWEVKKTKRRPEMPKWEYKFLMNKNHLDEPAMQYGSRIYTHREYQSLVHLYAKAFKNAGVAVGDNVVMFKPNTPAYTIMWDALVMVGACMQPIPYFLDAEALKQTAIESNSDFIVVDSQLVGIVEEVRSGLSNLKHVFVVDRNDLVAEGKTYNEEFPKFPPINDVEVPNDGFYINVKDFLEYTKGFNAEYITPFDNNRPIITVRTSGTTGAPKRVILSNDNLASVYFAYKIGGTGNERGYKYSGHILQHLVTGAAVQDMGVTIGWNTQICSEFHPMLFPYHIEMYGCDFIVVTSVFWDALYAYEPLNDYSSFKVLFNAGEKLITPRQIGYTEKFTETRNCKTRVIQAFGMSEVAAPSNVARPIPEQDGTVGYDLPLIETDIDENGMLMIFTPGLMLGYNDEEKTKQAVTFDKHYGKGIYSGDVAKKKNGLLEVLGRTGDVFTIKGFNVIPDEIEDVIMHPDINQGRIRYAIYKGIPIPNMQDKLPVLFLVINEGFENDEVKVADDIRVGMAKHGVDTDFLPYKIIAIPLSEYKITKGSNKVDRKAIGLEYTYERLTGNP
jgi:acyl-CoA synthetase (AMP-forming)/AMP-acid ligase II